MKNVTSTYNLDNFPIKTDEKAEFPQEKQVLDLMKKWMGNIDVMQQGGNTTQSTGAAKSQAKGAGEEKKEEKKEVKIY